MGLQGMSNNVHKEETPHCLNEWGLVTNDWHNTETPVDFDSHYCNQSQMQIL